MRALPIFVLLPLLALSGIVPTLFSVFSEEEQNELPSEIARSAQNVPLLKAATHSDPNPSKGGGDIIVDGGALVPEGSPSGSSLVAPIESGGTISVHKVLEGDTPSQIAELYDVSLNTILWANDIRDPDLIQTGDELVILPITGVQHVVKSGDTLASLAEKYDGEVTDIMAYNGLPSESAIAVGDVVVIPGGEVPTPKLSTTVTSSSGGSTLSVAEAGGFVNPLPGSVKTQGIHGYNGVDLASSPGATIRAAAAGEVILVRNGGWNGGYGNYIVVKHANGTQTLYAHNSQNYVVAGQYVAKGEAIGAVGSTGRSTGNHLHFEVRGGVNPF